MSLVEKLKNLAEYEIGFPMIDRMSHNHIQTELNLRDRQYFKALKSAGKTLFYTAQEAIWLATSALEVAGLYRLVDGIYSGDLKSTATGAGTIVLSEIIKDIMNNPQRYYIVRPRKNAGTTGGIVG